MQLDGTHIIEAPAQTIWNLLLDPEVLAKITPGVSSLEPTGEDQYNAISEVKIGPVSGKFTGKIQVQDKVEPEQFTLKMKQNSKMGNVSAEGQIQLNQLSNNQTEVIFNGKAKLSGTLARTGQRVLGGVARSLTNEFFKALEKEVEATKGVEVPSEGFFQKIIQFFKRLFGG